MRKLDPSDPSNALQSFDLSDKYFGEGITVFQDKDGNDKIIQLTWKERTGFIYDMDFNVVKEFSYETTTSEGWGITYDERNTEFIVSDGSNILHFWDRDTLQETKRIPVHMYGDDSGEKMELEWLNELEVVYLEKNGDAKSFVLANVYGEDVLLQIDPEDGRVTNIHDFRQLYLRKIQEDVFNGIAVSAEAADIVFVTGKNWPQLYKVKLSI